MNTGRHPSCWSLPALNVNLWASTKLRRKPQPCSSPSGGAPRLQGPCVGASSQPMSTPAPCAPDTSRVQGRAPGPTGSLPQRPMPATSPHLRPGFCPGVRETPPGPGQGAEGPGVWPQGVPGRPALRPGVAPCADGRLRALPGARLRPSQAAGPGEPGYLFRLESEGGAVSKPFPAQILPPRQLGPLHFRGQRGMGPRTPRRNPRRRQRAQAFRASRAPPAPQVLNAHRGRTWEAPARSLHADKTGPCSPH